jgi:hypothetical protein
MDCFGDIITLLDSTTKIHVGIFFVNHLASLLFVEDDTCSRFQTHSNIYTAYTVNIVEQYIGASENSQVWNETEFRGG